MLMLVNCREKEPAKTQTDELPGGVCVRVSDRERERERVLRSVCCVSHYNSGLGRIAGVPSNVTGSLRLPADRRSPDFISRSITISQTTSGGHIGHPAAITHLLIPPPSQNGIKNCVTAV